MEIPVISEPQVWKLLRALKTTSTGTDQILYWVWKEHTDIFTPSYHQNLKFLNLHSVFTITLLSKVDVPKAHAWWLSRYLYNLCHSEGFENIVYDFRARDTIENDTSAPHSSPTKTVETVRTYALLSIQQDQQLLDNPDCNAVRMLLWTSAKLMTLLNMNFLLINQRMLPLNPIIINWYLKFLKDRKQQLNNFGCDWKPVNKGTYALIRFAQKNVN